MGAVRIGNRGWVSTALALLLAVGAAAAHAQEGSARGPVMDFEGALIESMRSSRSVDLGRRKEALARMMSRSFDVPIIVRAVLDRYWERLSEAEREGLSARIRDYAVTVLATRFVDYQGERFEPEGEALMDPLHVRVRSRFVDADGDVTQLDYVVRNTPAGPRIVNVYFDGVSGTDIQRSEFQAFLRDGGAKALMERLDALIRTLES